MVMLISVGSLIGKSFAFAVSNYAALLRVTVLPVALTKIVYLAIAFPIALAPLGSSAQQLIGSLIETWFATALINILNLVLLLVLGTGVTRTALGDVANGPGARILDVGLLLVGAMVTLVFLALTAVVALAGFALYSLVSQGQGRYRLSLSSMLRRLLAPWFCLPDLDFCCRPSL